MKSYRDIPSDGGSGVAAQVAEQRDRVGARLSAVRHVVAVVSGKGGVGKSSVAAHVASSLSLAGAAVGILDADINGSSVPTLAGLAGARLTRGATGMIPPVSPLGVKVVSIDFLLADGRSPVMWNAPTQQDAYTWRATMEMGAVREFLSDTEWGALDFLIVDMPPGTDKLPNLVDLLPRLAGTVVVTIPSRVSQFVVTKSIRMAREVLATPVIGLVENMSVHVCGRCGGEQVLFPGVDAEALAADEGVPFLGRVPFDPRIADASQDGTFMATHGDTPAGRALRAVAEAIRRFVEAPARSRPRARDRRAAR
jgi:ATP-binding protein involved in chromosome partitioning